MGLDLSAVRGVSVSGQQHGTVYWAKGAGQKLEAMTAPADAPGATASTPGGDDAEQAWGGEGKFCTREPCRTLEYEREAFSFSLLSGIRATSRFLVVCPSVCRRVFLTLMFVRRRRHTTP